MILRWTATATSEEDKEVLKNRILASKEVLEILQRMLKEDYESILKEVVDKEAYKIPAWSEYQADKIGSLRTISKIIKYLEV